jgi:cytoskeletal protein CcmA (bactofilin family)
MEQNIEDMNTPAETVVGPSVKIQGDLNSEGNIRIQGQVTGKVHTSQSVHVSEGAKITADVIAGNAVISGEVQGNLKIDSNLILQSTARVNGDISCKVLRVEDGALYSGKCNMKGSGEAAPVSASSDKKSKSAAEPRTSKNATFGLYAHA